MTEVLLVVYWLVSLGIAYRFGEAFEHDRHLGEQPERPENDQTCDVCHRIIVTEAHGNSPGDHDPAHHVAKAYGP